MDLALNPPIIRYFVPVIFEKWVDWIQKYRSGIDPNLWDALEKLKNNMVKVRSVIPSIWVDTNDGLLELLKKLKEAAYDADDLLDELEYLRLKKQVEDGDNVDNHSSHSKHKKASDYLSHKFKNIGKLFYANKKSNPVDMINEIARRLEHITSTIHSNSNSPNIEEPTQNLMKSSLIDHHVTTSLLVSELNIFGREKEREEIIELLLNPPKQVVTSFENVIIVLPIVGMGGVGKTTLAQLVYNDERVKLEFDVRIWVHVSQQFDLVQLTREMLEGLGVPKSELSTELNNLQYLLIEKLRSKRFLIFLDDVWSLEMSNWEMLCAPLHSGKPGSQILITTRLVFTIMNHEIYTMSPINLKGLPEEECWPLFVKYAFGGGDVGNRPKLEKIGREIFKKLRGSPLAAKTVGGFLRENLDVDYWQSILESNIWELKQNIDDIMPALRLSYEHLPPHLQQCFAYCSVFPKGYKFEVKMFVAMWIAQGYVQDKTSDKKKSLMDTGREYFNKLKMMSFFETNDSDQWFVHESLHDLAKLVSADECFSIDGTEQLKGISRTVRHLFVRLDMIEMDVLKSSCNLKNLRTLIIQGDFKDHMATLEDLFNELRRVRVLYLNDGIINDVPKKIGHMIQLRCMVVQGGSKLPHSCNQLYQLQFSKYYNSTNHFPIGKLTCLQELEWFYLGKKEGHGIGQLKNLRELGGSLELFNIENIANKTEALEAQLNLKEHLLKLELIWDVITSPKVAEEVLEGLQPPRSINVLVINNYPGFKSPTWVSGLTCLTTLEIYNAELEDKELTLFLQDLMSLSTLIIIGCPKITTLPLLGGLHHSKACTELYIRDCPELMSMVGLEALVSVEMLTVLKCPKLIKSMSLTLRVGELKIDDPALLTVLLKSTQSLNNLRSLIIQSCKLAYLNIDKEICLHLTSLQSHEIFYCTNLKSLQPAYLKSLPSIKVLNVEHCWNLQSLPLMPASLKTLSVRNCLLLPKGRYQEGGKDCHNIAHVSRIIWP